MRGHFKKAGVEPTRRARRVHRQRRGAKVGDESRSTSSRPATRSTWSDQSKGKGFQGVVKRHGFGGGRATHGSMFHRAPGSIGASAFPSRVMKGMRMAGRMGGDQVTVKNLAWRGSMPRTTCSSSAAPSRASNGPTSARQARQEGVSHDHRRQELEQRGRSAARPAGRDLRVSVQGASRPRGRRDYLAGLRRARTRPRPAPKSPAPARSRSGRRAPAAPAPARRQPAVPPRRHGVRPASRATTYKMNTGRRRRAPSSRRSPASCMKEGHRRRRRLRRSTRPKTKALAASARRARRRRQGAARRRSREPEPGARLAQQPQAQVGRRAARQRLRRRQQPLHRPLRAGARPADGGAQR